MTTLLLIVVVSDLQNANDEIGNLTFVASLQTPETKLYIYIYNSNLMSMTSL